MSGYIKLRRSLKEWEWYDDHNATRMLVHLLIHVNYTDRAWKGMTIKKGSLVTSWSNLSNSVGLSIQQARTAICKLEKSGEVTSKSTSKNITLSLVKWDKMQIQKEEATSKSTSNQQADNKQITSKQQANNKQITTTKEGKEREERKEGEERKKIEYEKVIEAFNFICKNLPSVQKLTAQRKIMIKSREKEYGLEKIGEVFKKVSASDFLNGENDRGWTADFDWILKPSNFIKILEGKYDSIKKTQHNKKENGYITNHKQPTVNRQTAAVVASNSQGWEIE